MADSFDENRLAPSTYQIDSPVDAIRYQNTVMEFFDIVRTGPDDDFVPRMHLIQKFITFLNDNDAWQLAIMVVPELRRPQTFDTSQYTVMNAILKGIAHRRPPPPFVDPSSHQEKLLLKRRVREAIEYIEAEGRGAQHVTPEEYTAISDLTVRAMNIVGKFGIARSPHLSYTSQDCAQSVPATTTIHGFS